MKPQLRWPLETLWQAIEPRLTGFTLECLPLLDSSNEELMRRARAGSQEPILLVVEQQTAGKGRLGRSWTTAEPGQALTFSLGLPYSPQSWEGVSLVVALAVVAALDPDASLGLQIKWPNDIWLEGQKLAGILCETLHLSSAPYLVVGIGINITAPPSLPQADFPSSATYLQPSAPALDAPSCLGHIAPVLVDKLGQFAQTGFSAFQAAYAKRDALAGKTLVLSDGRRVQALGVDAAGALQILENGVRSHLLSGELRIQQVLSPSSTL